MTTWQPNEKILDITAILAGRKAELGANGDIYLKYRNSKFSETINKFEEVLPEINSRKNSDANERSKDKIKKLLAMQTKIDKVRTVHDYLIDEEIIEADRVIRGTADDIIEKFNNPFFLCEVRRSLTLNGTKMQVIVSDGLSDTDSDTARNESKQKKPKRKRSTGEKAIRQKPKSSDGQERGKNEGSTDPNDWSEARKQAYSKLHTNPNDYYFRHNEPGESKKTGPWTEEEIVLFEKRLQEFGDKGPWGLFSQTIPGRVGYQCSSFYKKHVLKILPNQPKDKTPRESKNTLPPPIPENTKDEIENEQPKKNQKLDSTGSSSLTSLSSDK